MLTEPWLDMEGSVDCHNRHVRQMQGQKILTNIITEHKKQAPCRGSNSLVVSKVSAVPTFSEASGLLDAKPSFKIINIHKAKDVDCVYVLLGTIDFGSLYKRCNSF